MTLDDAEQMAYTLMAQHGLYDWKFQWMQVRKRFNRAGQCSCWRKTIWLQPRFVICNYPETVRMTVLHEIAHALTPGAGHSKVWKEKARSIGHTGNRYYGKEVKKRKSHLVTVASQGRVTNS